MMLSCKSDWTYMINNETVTYDTFNQRGSINCDIVEDKEHKTYAIFDSTNIDFICKCDYTTYKVTCRGCVNCQNCYNFCINCYGCVDCEKCTYCRSNDNCSDCMDTMECDECRSVKQSIKCRNCTECYYMIECSDCTNCSNCQKCSSCENCKLCIYCRDCTTCKSCLYCNNKNNTHNINGNNTLKIENNLLYLPDHCIIEYDNNSNTYKITQCNDERTY